MAIKMDDNYEQTEAQEGGAFQRPPSDGYIFDVLDCQEAVSSNNNPMVVFSLDIAEGPHKGAFAKFPIKFYQLCTGDHTARFKGVMSAMGKSNPGRPAPVSNGFFDSVKAKGMKVGGCLRDEEYRNKSGQVKISSKVAYLCSTESVLKGEVRPLDMKPLDDKLNVAQGRATATPPPHGEDDLPNW